MSRRRSSSPSLPKLDHSSGNNHPNDSFTPSRKPSWAHSLADSTIQEDTRIPSQSQRRSRQPDEAGSYLKEWNGGVSHLMKARRPSFALSTSESYQRSRKLHMDVDEASETTPVPVGLPTGDLQPSPEEGKGLRSSWEINVKDLVGDAVGNMSISPASRDIVLAARRGLFILDLEAPFSIPRFLPQGGTWDVADVQWNPHPSHAQYIVSTSSEKLLIWNLRLGGKTSIEHILRSHYRAITDINWHTTECDIVVSTGIDSWIWAWDLREPGRPIFGLSAFNAAGTQVKWNHQDGNLLASSHSNDILIWDRRKGSLPVTQIHAHSSKIYGIDWSRSRRNEIVTCSLDKSIKTWDITATDQSSNPEPKSCIRTTYPVWRARNLPFGEGILSLPQRGETTLEMYAKGSAEKPPHLVEVFEGHSDVVKEFVWRKGSRDDFQMITWSKDRTLRFWPIDTEMMQKVDYEVVRGRSMLTRTEQELNEFNDTFRNVPEVGSLEYFPLLSAPIGNRGILAEVRAPRSSIAAQSNLAMMTDQTWSENVPSISSATPTDARAVSTAATRSIGGTMSKGGTGAKSVVQVDQLAWLNSVKVGNKRGSSSGGGSGGGGSGAPSRLASISRPPSGPDRSASEATGTQRSGSLSREERKDGDGNQSLQDEITSVLTKLGAPKVVLEKHELTKKRTCTLGLHGPWGETSTVFMRVTFTFPRDYPHSPHPHGTPTVELERNPLISMRNRAYILKHLRRIREQERPCLESCLRFLLFNYEGESEQELTGSESSSDEDEPGKKKARDFTVSLLRNSKNLAEPRTSQGAFGPNGELICFFRSPQRIVRNVLRDLTKSAEKTQEEREPSPPPAQESPQPPPPAPVQQQPQQKASYFQSPSLVSDAVRRLGLAARDRVVRPIDPKQPEMGLDILRAMTNLLTVPQQKARRYSDSKSRDESSKNYALLPTRRSTVFLISTRNIAGADPVLVGDYVFTASSLAGVCDTNAVAARDHGRYDHERIFRTLRTLFSDPDSLQGKKERGLSFVSDSLAAQVITQLYKEIAKEKDIQMLAMISVLVLQTEHATIIPLPPSISRKKVTTPAPSTLGRSTSMDYFSLSKSLNAPGPTSPTWPRLPSPIAPPSGPSLSSSASSRGSWSNLFNPPGLRQWVQDNFKDLPTTPGALTAEPQASSRQSQGEKSSSRLRDSPGSSSRRRRTRKESSSPGRASKSWNDDSSHSSKTLSGSFSSAGHRQPSLRFVDSNPDINEKRSVIFEPPVYEEDSEPLFEPGLLEQFKFNIYFYSEILFRWQFYNKRLELLNAVKQRDNFFAGDEEVHRIGLHRVCTQSNCKIFLPKNAHVCPQCNATSPMPTCTICRLPVKGLSRTCLTCSHVTHISCWKSFEMSAPICPSGCGCFCTGTDQPFTRPSTRLGLTPPTSTLLLASDLR